MRSRRIYWAQNGPWKDKISIYDETPKVIYNQDTGESVTLPPTNNLNDIYYELAWRNMAAAGVALETENEYFATLKTHQTLPLFSLCYDKGQFSLVSAYDVRFREDTKVHPVTIFGAVVRAWVCDAMALLINGDEIRAISNGFELPLSEDSKKAIRDWIDLRREYRRQEELEWAMQKKRERIKDFMSPVEYIKNVGAELAGLNEEAEKEALKYAKELIEKAQRIVQEQNDNAGENE